MASLGEVGSEEVALGVEPPVSHWAQGARRVRRGPVSLCGCCGGCRRCVESFPGCPSFPTADRQKERWERETESWRRRAKREREGERRVREKRGLAIQKSAPVYISLMQLNVNLQVTLEWRVEDEREAEIGSCFASTHH